MKYLRSTTWGSKNKGIRKSGFLSKTQLLSTFYSVFNDKMIDVACIFDLKRFMPQSMNVKSLKMTASLSVPFKRAGLILIACGLVLVPCEWGRIFLFLQFLQCLPNTHVPMKTLFIQLFPCGSKFLFCNFIFTPSVPAKLGYRFYILFCLWKDVGFFDSDWNKSFFYYQLMLISL